MAIKLQSTKADLARENEGDWVDIPELPGVRLKVRGNNYAPYQMAKSVVEARWARRYAREPVPPDILLRENGRLYAEHILVDWEGFDVPYDAGLARETLLDPGFRTLHEHIRYAMQQVSETDAVFVEDTARNLSPSSSGN